MALSEQQVTIAVDWWQKALTNERDRGAAITKLTDEQIKRFGVELDRRIRTEEFAKYPRLGVEYGPSGLLKDAIDAVIKFSGDCFPWHTIMWFEDGGVQVGYGSRRKALL